MMKVLATHNDLDGIGNKILSLYFGLDFNKYIILDYNFERTDEELVNSLLEYDTIYFTDFCPSKEFLEKALGLNKQIYIYDHHDSSLWVKDMQYSNLKVYHSLDMCGTKIFCNFYIKSIFGRLPLIIDYFVQLINTYDTWQITSFLWEESQNLNRILYKTIDWNADSQSSYNRFVKLMLVKLDTYPSWRWTNYEIRLIEEDKQKEKRILEESNQILQKRYDEKGKKFGLFKARSKISIVCANLLQRHKDLDYIICINTFKENENKLSCRSLGFDTTQLSIFEGHKEASGGQMGSKEEINDFWEGFINSIPYK